MKFLFTLGLALFFCALVKANNFYVTNTANSGPGSLQRAIISANANPGADYILMNIPGIGPHTINLHTPLPPLTGATRILGNSEAGFAFPSEHTPAVIKVAINGAAMGAGSTGLSLGNYCHVVGLAIYGFDTNLKIAGNFNTVSACHIGLDASGTVATGNSIDNVIITGNANLLGGGASDRNVIAGAGNGIIIFPYTVGNRVIANYIGTDATGNTTIPGNGFDGITVSSNNNEIIGNVIVGYGSNNILIGRWSENDPVPQGNIIRENQIGHHADGSFSSFTNNCQGVSINDAMNTTIQDNVIFGNGCHGVLIDGDAATGNLVSQNAIYGNNGLAINLGLDGVTANDPGDSDVGPNQLLNYPVLQSAKIKPFSTKVKGFIDTPYPRTVRVEFYANPAPHSTGYGDGQTLIGLANPKKNGSISTEVAPVAPGTYISAITIDSENNTSEFSLSIEATSPGGGSGNNRTAHLPNGTLLTEESAIRVSAFPNPFFEETTIAYQLSTSQQVKLSVFDAAGQLIQVLKNAIQEAGTYQVRFDTTNLPAGVYFYHLVTNGEVRAGKMISK